jgi:hypothetical protein
VATARSTAKPWSALPYSTVSTGRTQLRGMHKTRANVLSSTVKRSLTLGTALCVQPRTSLVTPTFAFRTAQHYEHGTGRANTRNHHKAVGWYETAAASGHREAQRYLGELCLEGHIVKKDVWRAVGYLQSAADQGDEIALRTLRIQSVIRNARDAYEDDDGDDD